MACSHIHRPMTPVPIQPMRVLPGCATVICIASVLLRNYVDSLRVVIRAARLPRQRRKSTAVTTIPKLDAPIVLVHGLCGYDRIIAFGHTLMDYFPGIREKLEAAGNRVFVP